MRCFDSLGGAFQMTRTTRSARQRGAQPIAGSSPASNAGLVEIQVKYQAIADLVLDARNPRQHSQRQINQLADSICEFGFVMPVVTDNHDRVIIGHGWILAAKKLGMAQIPV